MAVASARNISINLSGDFSLSHTASAAANAASPGHIEVKTLASGANTITPPASGTTPKAVTIIPPTGNAVAITLKGVTGDTGVALHKTDPTSIALDNPAGTFVLTAGAQIDGVRLIWT